MAVKYIFATHAIPGAGLLLTLPSVTPRIISHSVFRCLRKNVFFAHSKKLNIVQSLREREVACSTADRQGRNLEYYVWMLIYGYHPQHQLIPTMQRKFCFANIQNMFWVYFTIFINRLSAIRDCYFFNIYFAL